MKRNAVRTGFDTDEEYFRYPLRSHGNDRSLSALRQIFYGAPAALVPVPAAPFLQNPE